MTRREWLRTGILVLSAAGGVLAVATAVGGVFGKVLTFGAGLSALSGDVFLVVALCPHQCAGCECVVVFPVGKVSSQSRQQRLLLPTDVVSPR